MKFKIGLGVSSSDDDNDDGDEDQKAASTEAAPTRGFDNLLRFNQFAFYPLSTFFG